MIDTSEQLPGVKPSDLPDWLLSRGSIFVTTADVARLLDVSSSEVAAIASRWRASGEAFSPAPGTYVPIPSQYRSCGAVPAVDFVDPLMNHLGHAYYVGYVSSAHLHGAVDQPPPVFQIVTTARLDGREVGNVRLAFINSMTVANKPIDIVGTPTGTMRVASPETAVLDLVGTPRYGGGLSNVATIIGKLIANSNLDVSKLAQVAQLYPSSVVQRTGWMVEHAGVRIGKDLDLARLEDVADRRIERTVLATTGPRRGRTNKRWRVVVNTEVQFGL